MDVPDFGKPRKSLYSLLFSRSLYRVYVIGLTSGIRAIRRIARRTMVENTSIPKFDVMKFDGTENFRLRQQRVKDVLVQQGLVKALSGKKAKKTSDDDWQEL